MSKYPTNFISEWYGVRLFPRTTGGDDPDTIEKFKRKHCPFLTDALETERACTKNQNSSGVCTITTTKDKSRDWIVCPYRVLERNIIREVTRRIFSDDRDVLPVFPVTHLEDEEKQREIIERGNKEVIYLFFQDKIGGEISLTKTDTTPELLFDITILECETKGDWLILKRYGIFEVQTMDFHGSYRHAVKSLESAVDLHRENFKQQLTGNLEWAGRGIEGPNIANVFKRTIYQLIIKFDLADRHRCAGVVLGLPEAVWESWKPHFGGLEWAYERGSGRSLDRGVQRNSWIFILSPKQDRASSDGQMEIIRELRLEARDLVRRAYEVVPDMLSRQALPGLAGNIERRIQGYYRNARFDEGEEE